MNHTRHSAIFDASELSVTLIGAGGIGSMAALVLGKMGVKSITIFDGDVVESVNVATQLHTLDNIGYTKVRAVGEVTRRFSDTVVYGIEMPITAANSSIITNPVIISGVDSIQSRKDIWAAVKVAAPVWYLDASMGAENFSLKCINFLDDAQVASYHKWITNVREGDIPDLPCTSRATFFTAAIAAGHIGAAIRHIVTDGELPFLIKHDIESESLITI